MGWGDPKGPRPFEMPPPSCTGTSGQVEAARAALHAWGCTGNNLAEEAQLAAERIGVLMRTPAITERLRAYIDFLRNGISNARHFDDAGLAERVRSMPLDDPPYLVGLLEPGRADHG